ALSPPAAPRGPASVASATVAVGAAAAHPAGTDIPPTSAAAPRPAGVAPPMPDEAPAKVVPKPRPAPSGATSPMVTPKGAPAVKWARVPKADDIIMMPQDSVTSTVLTELVTAPTPKKPWTAL